MRTRLHLTATAALLSLATAQDAAHTDLADEQIQTSAVWQTRPATTRAVDLAICLDTSGSMSGLIEATKQKLWSIVNDLALAEPEPLLRVALLTYGNDGYAQENGWVKLDVPLTTDLDLISQRLFALGTNGGTELVGRVVGKATDALEWAPDPMALKLIVVAGNESADQDQVLSFRSACKAAITRGVMVNSIYCGDPNDGDAAGWKEVARLADGHYANIDHDHGTLVIATPFDEQLGALSCAVNDTYLPLGDAGRAGWGNQVAQDRNAVRLNGANVAARAQTKGGKLYHKAWDLVERAQEEGFDWSKLEDKDLPEIMRPLDLAGRKAHVAKLIVERKAIHANIAELSAKRSAWVQVYTRVNGLDDSKSFDQALTGALRKQAASKGFNFKPVELEQPSPEELKAMLEQMKALEAAAKEAAKKAAEGTPAVAPPVRGSQTQRDQQKVQQKVQQQSAGGGGAGGC